MPGAESIALSNSAVLAKDLVDACLAEIPLHDVLIAKNAGIAGLESDGEAFLHFDPIVANGFSATVASDDRHVLTTLESLADQDALSPFIRSNQE